MERPASIGFLASTKNRVLAGLILVLVVVICIGLLIRSDEPKTIFDLEVGDCLRAFTNATLSPEVVDCRSPHKGEVFYNIPPETDPGAYPGEAALNEVARRICAAHFEEYVGASLESSSLNFVYVPPDATSWAEGERRIICFVTKEDASDLIASVRNSGR